ncbi:hypothetical protein [Pedobacter zeae]|uniref:Uncharacterized protein n=1 Tax=Pedobacter zeae TaxID=1737356 RepID=A0A7W6K9L6_9SPHI|nr:hypothetical protein [Pedobacter zeae]MBB4107745.1 hypothetical protein [Pedobacter zeae]GGG97310.1 hypothetical protein GCM10007422_09090 [Pedobacter zeae]
MTYSNPNILEIPNPTGLDVAVVELQKAIAEIPYIERSFGRAMIFKENINGNVVTLPKVYQGEKEYYNPLPNGNFIASTFILATGPEECEDFSQFEDNFFTRKVALVFWGNLRQIDPAKDYIFLEEIKNDVLNAIRYCKGFKSYDSYIDEKYSEVFKEFTSYISSQSRDTSNTEIDTQYLMYPYSGFRMNLTLTYTQPC